jgi:cytochrome c553
MKALLPLVLLTLVPGAGAAESARRELTKVIAATPDAQRGAELFRNCVSCHGTDANGDVAGSVPRIAGQHFRVLARQLVNFRHGKRWDYRMEGVTASHNAIPELQDVADVAAFVSQMDVSGPSGVGDGQFVEQGRAFYEAGCASCHGANGEGDDARQVPVLAGQHASYLSRQIYDTVDGRRPELARTHDRYFRSMEFQDVRGLADHLSRLRGSVAPVPPAPGSNQISPGG